MTQMHEGSVLKPTLIVSGVNITNTGLLAILSDALTSLSSEYRDTYEIIALVTVSRCSIFRASNS